jgi:sugar lactone lactonase YvrE
MRGWFSLPDAIKAMTPEQRVIIFQHPLRAPQATDVGQYEQLDPSGTRVWYAVSTAEGSSGGAAVDSDGRLFALHNAVVESDEEAQSRDSHRFHQDPRAAPETVVPLRSESVTFWS